MHAQRVVAIICAMESEATHLRRRLADTWEEPLARWRRTRGRLGGTTVDFVISGVGLINAAAATSALCILAPPITILNYGCAGAHHEDIAPGDVVIASTIVHYSAQIVLPDGQRRYMGFDYSVDNARVQTEHIPADPDLLVLAQRVAPATALPVWPGLSPVPRVHTGTVASADIWTQHGESIRTLHALHGSLCEEMEAAAIAQVAAIYGVPFLAVKDISNNELLHVTAPRAGRRWPMLEAVRPELGRRAALVVEAMVAAMA
jgi:5'-methylthioadenosine/S-adenosylhomocysteine nucleosidase